MIRGISIDLHNSYDTIDLLKLIGKSFLANKKLFISTLDNVYDTKVYSMNEHTSDIFTQKEWNTILNISTQMNFLELFVFPNNITPHTVNDYDDFKLSECEIAVLVYDSAYIDIYAKSIKMMEEISKYVKKLPNVSLELITASNDCRTRFSVF